MHCSKAGTPATRFDALGWRRAPNSSYMSNPELLLLLAPMFSRNPTTDGKRHWSSLELVKEGTLLLRE